jgi:hypothetical protein
MLKLKIFLTVLFTFFAIQTLQADDSKKELRKYINSVITEAKEADDPSEKREILNNLFTKLDYALETVQSSHAISSEESEGIAVYKEKVNEIYNELNGLNGFERVADKDLNQFANYSLQSLEQADQVIIISVTTLLLIIILAILIF